MNSARNFPYQDIVGDLLASTMRAQSFLVAAHRQGRPLGNLHGEINKQFSWLALVFREGSNRHFFDAPGSSLFPLRVDGLRKGRKIPEGIYNCLMSRLPPDGAPGIGSATPDAANKYWQEMPTRISRLIMLGFEEDIKFKPRDRFSITSPMAIIYDFLTVPDTPGSRAYALLALRNHLYAELNTVPDLGHGGGFSAHDIESELSKIWTSLRERHYSKGADKLSVGTKTTGVVRHFLAMRGVLRLSFKNAVECENYLLNGQLFGEVSKGNFLEMEKSPRLERLPDAGEVVNELIGLPLPIRGADTVFRGGMKFSSRGGLVMAIQGGAGCGKTSLALSFGAYLAPFGIKTLFITGEEDSRDLSERLTSLVPEGIRRLDFFGDAIKDAFTFVQIPRMLVGDSDLDLINQALDKLREDGSDASDVCRKVPTDIPKPCRTIIVLDGLHDFFTDKQKDRSTDGGSRSPVEELYRLVESAKALNALVILTTGHSLVGHHMLDYLVDIAIHLYHESVTHYGAKPDRRLSLTKTRHQLCASGTHGLQIAGNKGVRFSPQINYQLDRRSIWKVSIPNQKVFKKILQRTRLVGKVKSNCIDSDHAPKIFCDSHVFINGQGSGGKAALALKIALAPSFENGAPGKSIEKTEKVLVVSFLYPKEYYKELFEKLKRVIATEYGDEEQISESKKSRMEVIRFYPGHLKPNDLYNRIEWELDSAELYGDPYTCVVIDGIHNVFLQFPEIEGYKLFWPQIYNSLRSRSIMIITTHTTLSVPRAIDGDGMSSQVPPVDDNRSEPLRHAMVQKSDFQFEVDPVPSDREPYKGNEEVSSLFAIRTMSAIGQSIPKGTVLWSREAFTLSEMPDIVAG